MIIKTTKSIELRATCLFKGRKSLTTLISDELRDTFFVYGYDTFTS